MAQVASAVVRIAQKERSGRQKGGRWREELATDILTEGRSSRRSHQWTNRTATELLWVALAVPASSSRRSSSLLRQQLRYENCWWNVKGSERRVKRSLNTFWPVRLLSLERWHGTLIQLLTILLYRTFVGSHSGSRWGSVVDSLSSNNARRVGGPVSLSWYRFCLPFILNSLDTSRGCDMLSC